MTAARRAIVDRPVVVDEEGEQGDRIDQSERPLPRDDEGVEGCDSEAGEFEHLVAIEFDRVAAPPEPQRHDDRRPAKTDQQAIRTRHVRGRERRVLRLGARLVGEIKVDRVFRQHGDECQEGERQGLRDVDLARFGGPREQEGRAEDRGAGRDGVDDVARMPAEAEHAEPLQREQGHEGDEDQGATQGHGDRVAQPATRSRISPTGVVERSSSWAGPRPGSAAGASEGGASGAPPAPPASDAR